MPLASQWTRWKRKDSATVPYLHTSQERPGPRRSDVLIKRDVVDYVVAIRLRILHMANPVHVWARSVCRLAVTSCRHPSLASVYSVLCIKSAYLLHRFPETGRPLFASYHVFLGSGTVWDV